MAIRFQTGKPDELLNSIKKAIDDDSVTSWSYDDDGDFTHSTERWANEAWLRPSIGRNQLSFYIISPEGQTISKAVYGFYHGRFIDMVLTNFDEQFQSVIASALPDGADKIYGS